MIWGRGTMQSLNPHSVVSSHQAGALVGCRPARDRRSEPWHHSPRSRFEGGADRSSAGGVPEKAAQGCVSQRRADRYDEDGVPQTVGQVSAQRGPSPCKPRPPDRPVRRDGRVGSCPLRFESLRFNDERKTFELRAPARGGPVCTDDFSSRTFVVAVDRSDLPKGDLPARANNYKRFELRRAR